MIIKPDFKAFTLFSTITISIYALAFAAVFSAVYSFFIGINLVLILIISATAIVISAIAFVLKSIEYSKENYEIYNDRIRVNRGGLFSSSSTEILLRNVVKLGVEEPYIERKLFNSGNIEISSASTSETSKITLKSINSTFDVFEALLKGMNTAGLNINRDNLIQQEKPNLFAVFVNLASASLLQLTGLVFSFIYIFSFSNTGIGSGTTEEVVIQYIIFAIIFSSVFISFIKYFFNTVFKFFDISRRQYKLYSDCVYYHDGFLNRTYHLIPIQNISDTSTSQNLLQNFLNVTNVIASAKGSGNEIVFEQMNNGESFEDNLSKLILQNKNISQTSIEESTSKNIVEPQKQELSLKTNYYKQNVARAITGYLFVVPFLIFIFPTLLFIGFEIIKAFVTKYSFNSESITEEYKFLQSQRYKFNIEKITSFKIKTNLIDKLFDTFTLSFTSFGSSRKIEFKHLDTNAKLVEEILTVLDFSKSQPINTVSFQSNLKSYLIIKFVPVFIALLLIVTLIGVAYFSQVWWILLFCLIPLILIGINIILDWYKINSQKLEYYESFIKYSKGIINKTITYIHFSDIKDITSIKYPFDYYGRLVLNIAGEQGATVRNSEQTALLTNEISIEMYENICEVHDNFDNILQNNKFEKDIVGVFEEKSLEFTGPHVLNTIYVFILIPVLWVALPFVILKTIYTDYVITDRRLIEKSGVFFKTMKSVLVSKIDFIDNKSNFINDLFKTGTVTINTAGSTSPELILSNIPKYKEISKTIKESYN